MPDSYRRRLLVIYNPTAGRRKRARLEAYLDLLEEAGCAVEYRPTTKRGDAEAFARDATAARFDAVVAAGGDGTIAEVANGLPPDAAPLGIFPLGTANVLANEIGLPLEPKAVMRAVLRGPAKAVHVGRLEGRVFTIMAGVGFDAHVVAHLPGWLKRWLGKGAYVIESLRRLALWRSPRYRLVIDGVGYDCASAVIAKAHFYGGRFVCCPEADLARPDFQIALLQQPGRLGALRAMAALPLGLLPRLAEVQLLRGTRIEILGAAGEPVQADGDLAARLPAAVVIETKPIRLIAPG